MPDSYVCSGAMMRCTMGSSPAKLTVLPSRTVFLAGQPQANISDHKSMVNLAPFGVCRSLAFPPTAAATAAAHGHLTPMPCVHNTPTPWFVGKKDNLIKGQPALLQSCKCQCMWGGTISLINNGQVAIGAQGVNETPSGQIELDTSSPILAKITQESLKGFSPLREALKHLIELKKINPKESLKDIPASWKKEYIAAIKNINNNGIDGFASSYSDIEHAYNIYKLATIDAAKQYGLSNLSHMMPYEMFNLADKIPGFLEAMPTKKFWDTFDTYIPFYINKQNGAFFSPNYGYVNIDNANIKRMTDSDWYKAGLIHHEFGHAQDHLRGWKSSKEFKDVFEAFQKEVIDDNVEDKLNKLINEYKKEGKYTADVQEKLGGLSDCIQAALQAQGIERVVAPAGHFTWHADTQTYTFEYFNNESLRMAEFIAHSSENYWSENDLFQSLCPNTYEKMREVIKNSLYPKH